MKSKNCQSSWYIFWHLLFSRLGVAPELKKTFFQRNNIWAITQCTVPHTCSSSLSSFQTKVSAFIVHIGHKPKCIIATKNGKTDKEREKKKSTAVVAQLQHNKTYIRMLLCKKRTWLSACLTVGAVLNSADEETVLWYNWTRNSAHK